MNASYDAQGRPVHAMLPRESVPLALLLLTVLALLLRLFHLGEQSLWVDELLTIRQGQMPGTTLWEQFLDDPQAPLPMLLVALLGKVSAQETLLRLPGALLGALTVPVFHEVARRVAGARAALFAALLLAVHPMHIAHSQEVRGYAYLVFFALAATMVALEAQGRLGWRRGIALVLLGVAAALSNLQGLFWMAGLALGLLLYRRIRPEHLWRWGLAFVAMVALTAPWWSTSLRVHETGRLLPQEEIGEPLRGSSTFTPWALPYAGFVLSMGTSLGPTSEELHLEVAASGEEPTAGSLPRRHWPWVGATSILVILLAGYGLQKLGWRGLEPGVWASVAIVLAVVLAARNVKPFNPRYVIAALPWLLILVGAGLDRLRPRLAVVALAAWLLLTGVSLHRMYFVPAYAHEDVRGAVALVEQREGADDLILAPTVHRVFEHYYRGRNPLYGLHGHRLAGEEAYREALAALSPERRYLWYVRSRPWFDDPRGELIAVLDADHRLLGDFRLPGVALRLYDRWRGPAADPEDPPLPGGESMSPPADSAEGDSTRAMDGTGGAN